MNRIAYAAVFVSALASAATFSGSPQFTISPPGPVLTVNGGRFGVKARSEDMAARFAILDATDPDVADKAIAEVQLEVSGTVASRSIAFSAAGWREQVQFGSDVVTIDVVPLAEGAFGVAVQAPLGLELTLRASISGTPSDDAQAPAVEGGGYAVAIAGDGVASATAADVSRTVAAPTAWTVFVIGVGTDVASARTAALTQVGATETWLQSGERAFAAELGAWTKIHSTSAARDALNASAIAQLRANETLAGFVAHKSHRNLYWLWDSTLQSLALTERSGSQALGALRIHQTSQVDTGDERGLLFARVDATGASPSLNVNTATDFFTQLAPLGLPMRAMQDRAGVPPGDLVELYDAGRSYVDWLARRRDRDHDFRYELNGGLEHPIPDDPRFDVFAPEFDTRLPLPDSTRRPALNAVDVSSWTAHLMFELGRVAEQAVSAEEANLLRENGTLLLGRIEDEQEGFAATDTWIDYTREGEGLVREFGRAGTYSWAPLSSGIARTREHITSAVERDPAFTVIDGKLVSIDKTIHVAQAYLAAMGLYRYGYEAEAAALIEALVGLLASHPNLHDAYSEAGQPIGPGGSGAAAAIAIEALRNRHQEEAFALEKGGVAKKRAGHLRRLFRLNDGRVLMEVATAGTSELPLTTITAQTQLFSGEPMTLTFGDPNGFIGDASVTVSFPILDEATVVIRRADGSEERQTLRADSPTVEVRAGDELELTIVRFAGERSGCGCRSGSEAVVPLLGLAWIWARSRRRKVDTSAIS